MIPSGLGSPEWANLVKALLHTLWQGSVFAALLGVALRQASNPVVRYRCALGALAGIVIAGLVTWGLLSRPLPVAEAIAPSPAAVPVATPAPVMATSDLPPVVVQFRMPEAKPPETNWMAWLALIWLAGTVAMLGRAGFQVAGAEWLRRSSRPLEDVRITALLAEASAAMGLARHVRLAVTDQLSSPVVAGVLVPTLILPLTLTTTLTSEQIRFILLHELAHIRRGDYFANLFQLFTEALLFFNPAVWWISRQVRLEREACCDALAVELSGAPADYARTLLRVVEHLVSPTTAAPAFRGERGPSSLADRVQRMLVPGYRPALRLTWRAMIAALATGGMLLFLSAVGTRVTIAAILSPQERIQRIEKKMAEYGESPAVVADNDNDSQARKVKIAGSIHMADGSPAPKWLYLRVFSSRARSTYGFSMLAKDGKFSDFAQAGTIYLGAEVTNYAPAVVGPLDGLATNDFEDLEMVFDPGFDVALQAVDADSGKLLTNGIVGTGFWMDSQGFGTHLWPLVSDGKLMLPHCADLPLDVTVNAPGYYIVKKHFEHFHAGEALKVALRRGETISGTVLDRATGQPIPGAEFQLLYQNGGKNVGRFEWTDPLYLLGTGREDGTFSLNQLQRGATYYIGVSAAGHESLELKNIAAGATGLVVKLGPELVVHGHVTGQLDQLRQSYHEPQLMVEFTQVYGNNSSSTYAPPVPVQITNGVGTFVFTNRTAGPVKLMGGSYSETREVTGPIDDWVVDLQPAKTAEAKPLPKREVIFRFQPAAGVPPEGTVEVTIPVSLEPGHLSERLEEMAITNGSVRVEIPVGGETRIEPKHLVGYWFDPWKVGGSGFITVSNGNVPLVIDVPLIPAGAIYAQARNADGTPAGGLMFGVTELKRAPGRDSTSTLDNGGDSFSGNGPRKWVSGPLPLGGTYQVQAWRGNSFCVSQPIRLTESEPDAEVVLQFPPGKTFRGTVLEAEGKPLRDAELKGLFLLSDNHTFGLNSIFTDGKGQFELAAATPDVGTYTVEADAPGIMAESVALDFKAQPQIIRLKRGRVLGGQLVDANTGGPLPGEEVRVLDFDSNKLPAVTTQTDADGRFEFTTLGDVRYTLFVQDGIQAGALAPDKKYRADGNTNLVLRVRLYAWSDVKPKATAGAGATNAAGVMSNTNFQAALRALAQETGTTNMDEPEITTVTGLRSENRAGLYPERSSPLASVVSPTSSVGILEDTNFQVALYALKQKTGIDHTNQPSITSGSAGRAHVLSDVNRADTYLERSVPVASVALAQRTGTNDLGEPKITNLSSKVFGLRSENRAGLYPDRSFPLAAVSATNSVGILDDTNSPVGNVELKPEPRIDGLGERQTTKLRVTGLSENQATAYPEHSAREAEFKIEVLITARFYRMPVARFNEVVSGLKFNQGRGYDDGWWSISPVEVVEGHPLKGLDSPDATLLSDLRFQTTGGFPAAFDGIVGTNKLNFDLTATVTNDNVNLTVDGQFVERNGELDPTNYFAANAALENLGGLVIRGRNANRSAANEFAAILTVQLLTNGLSLQSQPPAVPMTNAEAAKVEAQPQVHLKARFYEVSKGTAEEFEDFLNLTNPADSRRMGILDPADLKAVLQDLKARSGIDLLNDLGEPEITTLSGRRARMRATDSVAVFPDKKIQGEQINSNGIPPNGQTIELGPSLDAVPRVLADGNTISLETTASVTGWPPVLTESGSANVNMYDNQTLLMRLDSWGPVRFGGPDPDRDAAIAKTIKDGQKNGGKEIVVLVTATLVDPVGNRVHADDPAPAGRGKIPPQPAAGPGDSARLVQDGKLLYEMGQYPEAAAKLNEAIRTDPSNASALYYEDLTKQAQTARAVAEYENTNHARVATGNTRQAIVDKLKGIRLDSVLFDGLPLSEVLKQLSEQCRLQDPEHQGINFLINHGPGSTGQPRGAGDGLQIDPNTGLPIVPAKTGVGTNVVDVGLYIVKMPERTNACLADVLDAIVLTSDRPIQYSVQDFGVVFSAKGPEAPQLFMRTFRVDPNTFDLQRAKMGLDNLRQAQTNSSIRGLGEFDWAGSGPAPSTVARAFFTSLGIDLNNPPGKSVFFNEQIGLLFVKATETDLDKVQSALEMLNRIPPQVHLKVRIYEAPVRAVEHLRQSLTNAAVTNGMFRSVLTSSNTAIILQTLRSQKEFEELGEPAVVVLSGRQTQMSITEYRPVIVAGGTDDRTGRPLTEASSVRTGPVVDVVPYVLADGYTINLALIPSDTEFDGYHPLQLPKFTGNTNVAELPAVLPKVTTRQFVSMANVWDNQTVVLGGLMSSTVYAMKDKVPILGDLPLLGRFYRSQSKQTNQTELVIFVTATIVDPAGKRVHADDELPFAQEGVPVQPAPVDASVEAVSSTAGMSAAHPAVNSSTTNTLVLTRAKLESIRLGDVTYDALPLSRVIRQLADQCRLEDPEHQGVNFLINNGLGNGSHVPQIDAATGLPVGRDAGSAADTNGPDVGDYTIKIPRLTNVRLADVLDAIVLTSDHPLTYSVQDFAVVFSAKDPNALFVRTFLVNRKAFDAQFHLPTGDKLEPVQTEPPGSQLPGLGVYDFSRGRPNPGSEMGGPPPSSFDRGLFGSLGIDPANPPGKSVYINGLGMLFVRATESDLDKVEHALQALPLPLEAHLKVRFYAVDASDGDKVGFSQYRGKFNLSSNQMAGTGGPRARLTVPVSAANPLGAAPSQAGSSVVSPFNTNQIPQPGTEQDAIRFPDMTGTMTKSNFSVALSALDHNRRIHFLWETEMTLPSGQQAQFMITRTTSPLAMAFSQWHQTKLESMPTRPEVDIVAHVLAEDDAIQVYAAPSPKELWETGSRVGGEMRLASNVKLWDGQTLVMQRWPRLPGDKNSVSAAQSPPPRARGLLMFITATIVDPAGKPVHADDELPFAQKRIPAQP